MHIQTKSALGELPFFARLSPHVRTCLLGKSVLRSHPQGSTISLQGDESPTLKVVVDGWVKVYRLSSGGTETTLAMLDHGHSFDEVPALTKGGPSPRPKRSAIARFYIWTLARSAPVKTHLLNCT